MSPIGWYKSCALFLRTFHPYTVSSCNHFSSILARLSASSLHSQRIVHRVRQLVSASGPPRGPMALHLSLESSPAPYIQASAGLCVHSLWFRILLPWWPSSLSSSLLGYSTLCHLCLFFQFGTNVGTIGLCVSTMSKNFIFQILAF